MAMTTMVEKRDTNGRRAATESQERGNYNFSVFWSTLTLNITVVYICLCLLCVFSAGEEVYNSVKSDIILGNKIKQC